MPINANHFFFGRGGTDTKRRFCLQFLSKFCQLSNKYTEQSITNFPHATSQQLARNHIISSVLKEQGQHSDAEFFGRSLLFLTFRSNISARR